MYLIAVFNESYLIVWHWSKKFAWLWKPKLSKHY